LTDCLEQGTSDCGMTWGPGENRKDRATAGHGALAVELLPSGQEAFGEEGGMDRSLGKNLEERKNLPAEGLVGG